MIFIDVLDDGTRNHEKSADRRSSVDASVMEVE